MRINSKHPPCAHWCGCELHSALVKSRVTAGHCSCFNICFCVTSLWFYMNLFKFPFFSHGFLNNPQRFLLCRSAFHTNAVQEKKCFLLCDLETILAQVMVVKRFVGLFFYDQCMQDSYGSTTIMTFMWVH